MSEKTAAKPMDTETIKRGIRASEVGLAELEKLFRRDIDRIRDQLAELHRSIELGEPTEYVERFGLARQIANAARMPRLATELANDLLYGEYYAGTLALSLWPLLSIANGIEDDDELKNHIRMWCHGGAIVLDEGVERAMFEAAGLPYKRARVTQRILADVLLGDAEDDEKSDAA